MVIARGSPHIEILVRQVNSGWGSRKRNLPTAYLPEIAEVEAERNMDSLPPHSLHCRNGSIQCLGPKQPRQVNAPVDAALYAIGQHEPDCGLGFHILMGATRPGGVSTSTIFISTHVTVAKYRGAEVNMHQSDPADFKKPQRIWKNIGVEHSGETTRSGKAKNIRLSRRDGDIHVDEHIPVGDLSRKRTRAH